MSTTYAVIPADGHFSSVAIVMSSHRSLSAAKRNAGRGYQVIVGALAKGDKVYADTIGSTYPRA